MANQESPSFEDLEPEGDFDGIGHAMADDQDSVGTGLDGDAIDAMLGDEMADFETCDAEPARLCRSDERHRNTRSGQSARMARKRTGNITQRQQSNRRRPLTAPQDEWPEMDTFDESFPDLLDLPDVKHDVALIGIPDVPSTTLHEAHELMDMLASAASAAQDEMQAVGLSAAMVPLALGTVPNAYRALCPALPFFIRGVMRVARQLHKRPATRSRLGMMPMILQRTMAQIAYFVLHDQPVTRQMVSKVLTKQTTVAFRHPARSDVRRTTHLNSDF